MLLFQLPRGFVALCLASMEHAPCPSTSPALESPAASQSTSSPMASFWVAREAVPSTSGDKKAALSACPWRRCNFTPIYEYQMAEREKKKGLSKEVGRNSSSLLLMPLWCSPQASLVILWSAFVAAGAQVMEGMGVLRQKLQAWMWPAGVHGFLQDPDSQMLLAMCVLHHGVVQGQGGASAHLWHYGPGIITFQWPGSGLPQLAPACRGQACMGLVGCALLGLPACAPANGLWGDGAAACRCRSDGRAAAERSQGQPSALRAVLQLLKLSKKWQHWSRQRCPGLPGCS